MNFDWNTWRKRYSVMTTEEQKKFHNDVEIVYPDQKHFIQERAIEFFNMLCTKEEEVNVFEAGGWKGDLASIILCRHQNIKSWLNIELCENAVDKSVCKDKRYEAVVPIYFKWWEHIKITANVFIATHFIEHLSNEDLKNLLSTISSDYIYLEAPIKQHGQQWDNDGSTHILTIGWDDIYKLLPEYDIVLPITNDVIRIFKRKDIS